MRLITHLQNTKKYISRIRDVIKLLDVDLAGSILEGEQLVNEMKSSAVNNYNLLKVYEEMIKTFMTNLGNGTTSLILNIVALTHALLALGAVGGAVAFVACRNTYSRCCRLACCVPIALRDKVCRYSGGSTVGDQDQRVRMMAIEWLLNLDYKKDEVEEVAKGMGIPPIDIYPTKKQNIPLIAKKIIHDDQHGTRGKDERYIKGLKKGTKRGG